MIRRRHSGILLLLLACTPSARPQVSPPFHDETLRYSVNWPSGLSLGEGEMRAQFVKPGEGAPERWEFEFKLDAAIPGFQVLDQVRSVATPELCSIEFEKEVEHGKRKTREKTAFDPQLGTARRATIGGGKSEISVPACAKDGLTFLYFVRQELRQGRLPAAQTVLFGAPYRIRFKYAGTEYVQGRESRLEADRLIASVKGPASETTFEMVFARDDTRTPVLVKVPLSLGNFSLQLVP